MRGGGGNHNSKPAGYKPANAGGNAGADDVAGNAFEQPW